MVTTARKPFKLGFTGASLDAVLPWAAEQVGDAEVVAVAMAGSGKDIAYLAAPGRTIWSWDTQYLSYAIVRGIFAADPDLPEPVAAGWAQGYCSTHTTIRHMPPDAGGLADHIALTGSLYDKACLANALMRSTYMGRLATWARDATADSMYQAYLKAHARLAPWRGLPGTFRHALGSVSGKAITAAGAEVLYVDTPKVLAGGKRGDIYSAGGYVGMNAILAQEPQVLPGWTEESFLRDMPPLWQAQWDRMLLFHASGCRPTVHRVAAAMQVAGLDQHTVYQSWQHRGRTDVCWVVDK